MYTILYYKNSILWENSNVATDLTHHKHGSYSLFIPLFSVYPLSQHTINTVCLHVNAVVCELKQEKISWYCFTDIKSLF